MLRHFTAIFLLGIARLLHAQSFAIEDVFPVSDYSEVEERIQCITNEVPLGFNERVMAFVDYFAIKNRPYTQDIIDKKELYFPLFSEVLAEHNLPDELKYLSIVESGLRPNAVSRANATGLWQFISSTGKVYGLRSNWYIDYRMNPEKATHSACRFLKDLYRQFDNWELAIAAYNCGPGNVRKAIRRSGGKRKFWDIYRYLPRETRSYLPQYVAITYLFNHLEEHGFDVEPKFFMPEMDTIQISQYFHLETFADQLNVCVDDLLLWNPEIKRGALPEGTTNFALSIPKDVKDSVIANRAFLYDTAGSVGKEHLEYLARNMPGSTYGREKIVYRVRSGDVLGTIARKFNVRISDIKSWNRISGTMIRIGQRLNIWVLPTYSSKTKELYTAKVPLNTDVTKHSSSYYVKRGDTLWSISKATNTTIEKLRSANNLKSNTIQPGQSLIIPN